ncbi:MAG: nicotinate (nicotinamide) nucleotide adenylyltransferase [Fodinibius sp.]|nr:nicotinate (nicotinamide) nucleotide adenylyltransferase [Fodinibius sp.]
MPAATARNNGIFEKGIGLLGGSFDPVHNGHLAIARSFLNSDYISKLWVLLTPDPPHKTDETLSDYDQRLTMLKAAFNHEDCVYVSDIERQLPRPSYTVKTLEYLTQQYPEQQFYLCIGQDSLANFKQWKSWKQILAYCNLLVARRPENNTGDLDPAISENTHFVHHQPVAISSTQIRQDIASGKNISKVVPDSVRRIIEQSNLYKN